MHNSYSSLLSLAAFLYLIAIAVPSNAGDQNEKSIPKTAPITDDALVMIVMDPLAAPLSCPCVEGYAQRKYELLAADMQRSLGKPVAVVWNGSLDIALRQTKGRADIVIGKDSVIRFDAKKNKLPMVPVATLTGKDGSKTQHGLVVVRSDDPAQELNDLDGYTLMLGTPDAEEKAGAVQQLLKNQKISFNVQKQRYSACSEAAARLLKLPPGEYAATISSYAAPLLEGCGTIKKGDLRVVGKTAEVPFVNAYVNASLSAQQQRAIRGSLINMISSVDTMLAMETLMGFVPYEKPMSWSKVKTTMRTPVSLNAVAASQREPAPATEPVKKKVTKQDSSATVELLPLSPR
ncbi:MAG: PhnD/SsuA/transferrin family substrate-binding protein, partial [Planctomycetota bacterium]